ncbi:hypothetical protein F4809DRAFT_560025 [Biscogniauxia mediterranea]|nr:hypothetical protein F4809DRAFT_560025 [Biscogniauxia mediterranea]
MARMEFRDIFLRLPPATAILVLSTAFGISHGHALPRQTKTVAFHELDVVPFPPAPTEAPFSPFELLRRQDNTVCGYLGGDPNLPATCSAGSHCVLDSFNGVVGCCPNGGSCTTGVFTGCVDGNSDPQTEINPYIYTCQGGNVCYKNNFAGGYSQFGCGTASSLGTTVQTSADGASTALSLTKTILSPTATPTTLSEPTTVGSPSSTTTRPGATSSITSPTSSLSSSLSSASSSSSQTTSRTTSQATSQTTSSATPTNSTSSSSAASTESSTSAESATDSATPAPAAPEDKQQARYDRTGAIVGGTIGGAAALVAVIAVAAFCIGRQRKKRQAAGPTPVMPPTTEYSDPVRSHGAAFAPLPTWQDEQQQRQPPPPPPSQQPPYSQHYSVPSSAYNAYPPSSYYDDDDEGLWGGPGAAVVGASANNNGGGRHSPLRYEQAHMTGMGTSLAPVVEDSEHEPDPREIDEFSRAYAGAAGIGQDDEDEEEEEDMRPLRQYDAHASAASAAATAAAAASARKPSISSSSMRSSSSLSSSSSAAAAAAAAAPIAASRAVAARDMTDVDLSSPPEDDTSTRTYSRGGSGYRPLWQQNRQQTRNPAWF